MTKAKGLTKYVSFKEGSLYQGSLPNILLLLGLAISFCILQNL